MNKIFFLLPTLLASIMLKAVITDVSPETINQQDASGNTPLHNFMEKCATEKLTEETIKTTIRNYLSLGAFPDIKNGNDKKPQEILIQYSTQYMQMRDYGKLQQISCALDALNKKA